MTCNAAHVRAQDPLAALLAMEPCCGIKAQGSQLGQSGSTALICHPPAALLALGAGGGCEACGAPDPSRSPWRPLLLLLLLLPPAQAHDGALSPP